MSYDLIIKNGTIIDGSNRPRFKADIAIQGGTIAAIGTVDSDATEVIDASDCIVAPGFIDAHTHLDAQVFWEPTGTSSCYHGVTTAVFGNCGFTLAPIRDEFSDLLLEHFEAAEALPMEALRSGIDIQWKTFSEYFDVLDRIPKGINFASYVGHSALRIQVMGDRAFSPECTDAELAEMISGLEEALAAGAIGFSSSRLSHHVLRDGRLIASGHALWNEVCSLVRAMASSGSGVFEIAREKFGSGGLDDYDFPDRLKALAVETRVPTTLGVLNYLQICMCISF